MRPGASGLPRARSRVERRRLVVVTYCWPPAPPIGAHRWVAHDPSPPRRSATTSRSSRARRTGALPDDGAGCVRTGDLGGAATLRRCCDGRRCRSRGAPRRCRRRRPAVLTELVAPDSHLVSWAPDRARARRRASRGGGVDCLITTRPAGLRRTWSGSRSAAGGRLDRGLPRRLALRAAAPAVADARAGPAGRDALERRVARARGRRASAPPRPIAEDSRARLGADAHWVTNGFEPEQPSRQRRRRPPTARARGARAHRAR